ncbi:major facilitator superfamily domain-containing protein 8-like [Mya arenaria]|uniref:major facilitator superfamily domain-containing protein 8-like n=1 Tax=Mya arenaria TaxID=6604 RepID=UPI0022DF5418|nr:major facilitator superfamily domain-containing protein 8-like [Mya arenaria]
MSSRSKHQYGDEDDEVDEQSKLLRTIPPGISARSHSISGTQTVTFEKQEVTKSRWRSIRVMYLTMFLSSVSFSICMSSLYPYLIVLDKTATTDFLGWVVAAYSVGQLIASPFFGFWSNKRSSTREPIIVSLIINVIANVLYMYLESITVQPKWFLIAARVLIGFGAGNVAVVRSYVSGATTLAERTSAMANMSACQAIGFIIGPLIQTAMVPIGFPGPVRKPALHFDMYTATGFFSAIVGIINIVLLIVVFKEHRVGVDEFLPSQVQGASINTYENDEEEEVRPLDLLAVISSITIFFSVLFVFAVFETIATPLSMHMFAWTKAQATLYIGVILGCAGFVSIGVFVVIKILSKRFNERYLLLGGFVLCFLGFVVYLPWGHRYPEIQFAEIENKAGNTSVSFSSAVDKNMSKLLLSDLHLSDNTAGNLSEDISNSMFQNIDFSGNGIQFPSQNISNNSSKEAVGCPYYYEWCTYTPALFFWQFLFGTFFVAVGYPTCNVMSYTIYSKILGPKPQGVWMGWLTASGSLARTLGPVFVSQVYDAYGPRVTFIAMLVLIVITIGGFVAVFRRLVPYSRNKEFLVAEST